MVHQLNGEHVAAEAAQALADLRLALWERLRKALGGWPVKPLYACVFGSAARRDGGPESDIDLLLLHPPLPSDGRPSRRNPGLASALNEVFISLAPSARAPDSGAVWSSQIDELRGKVQRWTGNPVQIVDLSLWQWIDLPKTDPSLFEQISSDGIPMAGDPLTLLQAAGRG